MDVLPGLYQHAGSCMGCEMFTLAWGVRCSRYVMVQKLGQMRFDGQLLTTQLQGTTCRVLCLAY